MSRSLLTYSPLDSSPGLKPFEKKTGVYMFLRVPFDEEIRVLEPLDAQGNHKSYPMLPHEFERFVHNVLQPKSGMEIRILDCTWNMYRVAYDTVTERLVILKKREEDIYYDDAKVLFG
jgi:hypothetical protein